MSELIVRCVCGMALGTRHQEARTVQRWEAGYLAGRQDAPWEVAHPHGSAGSCHRNPEKPRVSTQPHVTWNIAPFNTCRIAWLCVPAQSCLTLCDPMDCSLQAPLSMGFSRQEYWRGLPCPPPGDLLESGIEPACLASPALAGRFFTTVPPGRPHYLLPSHLFTPRFL